MTRLALGAAFVALVLNVPALAAETIEEIKDVAYGPDELQRLDIYRAKGAQGRLPTVIWIHGGGWHEGDKLKGVNAISKLAPELVNQGYIAVSCNYRLSPKHTHPAQIDDVQRVVRWLRANADRYNIDPDRVGATGISAGGHLTCVLAVRETRSPQGDELDKHSSRVQAAVSLNGPTELRVTSELFTPQLEKAVANLTGLPENFKEAAADASPIAFVDKTSAPTLFIVGTEDTWVPPAHSRQMAEALKKNGVETDVLALEGAGHGIFPSITPKATAGILDWFEKNLKPRGERKASAP
ncbi:MAG: alpha/beta fold hydrolase [Planctomycetaceae bacterium]